MFLSIDQKMYDWGRREREREKKYNIDKMSI